MKKTYLAIPLTLAAVVTVWLLSLPPAAPQTWSADQLALIRSLSLTNLPGLPADPSNAVADNEAAAELGHALYFDTRLSSNGAVACASCHQPELMFSDGLELAIGVDSGPRHTPSLLGLSYSPWFYWDGRKDSQWAQALAPLEAAHEHNTNRVEITHLIANDRNYMRQYENLFGPFPDIASLNLPASASPLGNEAQQLAWSSLSEQTRETVSRIFSNLGKAIAAYERKIIPGPGRFDEYAQRLKDDSSSKQGDILSASEIAGLNLFIGQAQCISCHNGPLLSNHEFHNTGVLPVNGQLPSMGRFDGIRSARKDEFNCLGKFSDASESECIELRFARDENDLVGAQKTPTLRNITLSAPYMHGGQLSTLAEVMIHYNEAPVSMLNHNEAKPLGLRNSQLHQLEDFMASLTAPLATEKKWLKPPNVTISSATIPSTGVTEEVNLEQALQNPRRNIAHLLRDEIRKPAQVMEFLGIEPGMKVLDIYAADGYYSYVLSQVLGEEGKVYAQNPAPGSNTEDIRQMYSLADTLDETISAVPLPNVTHLREDVNKLSIEPGSLDGIMLVQILHDFYNNDSNYATTLLEQLKTLLKAGGFIAIIDHAGDSGQENTRLHRMEKEAAIVLAQKAGFTITGDSNLLENSQDRRRRPVFDPMLGRNTDRFLLKLELKLER